MNVFGIGQDNVLWGIARDGQVTSTGQGREGYERTWDQLSEGVDLVYHDPDRGWVSTTTGERVHDEREMER